MSLSSALSTAITGLSAQSVALSAISENIANSSTTAYKTEDTSFSDLVAGSVDSASSSSGVRASLSQDVTTQGQITSTNVSTNAAIKGGGYFVVTDNVGTKATSDDLFTRDGSFATDQNGNLINGQGDYLLGYATDSSGNITAAGMSLNGLSPINLTSISGTAKATTQVSMEANLPANANVGDTFSSSVQLFDSLGVSQTVNETWTKTAANAWTLALANPFATDGDPTIPTGTIGPSSMNISFDQNGILQSTSPSPSSFSVTGWTSGAADSNVTFNFGSPGSTSGLTQFASASATPNIDITKTDQDGARYGAFTNITIDDNGLVTAEYDNGLSQPIYKIPIATFTDPQGLNLVSGTTYEQSQDAGTLKLSLAGQSGAGSIVSSALEGSTTDTASEFNKMIGAQQAYSAAAQLVNTVDSMFNTLIQAVR
jgi:flagellar hook protein FlgE